MDLPMLERRAYVPKIFWYEDDAKVVMRIMLVDVENYFVDVDLDHIRFSTVHNERVYYLNLYLFGAIVPEKTVHKNSGREIRIQLVKAHKFLKWLRLEETEQKNPHISPDPDRIDDELPKVLTKVAEWDDFETYKIENRLNICPDVPSSDSDGSDDERYLVVDDF